MVRFLSLLLATTILLAVAPSAAAQPSAPAAADFDHSVATAWFDQIFELTREAPGFSPPVAARALGYAGVTLYEAVAPGIPGARSLAGQVNGLSALPQPQAGAIYHWPTVANSAMAGITRRLFAGAGETQRAAIDGLEISIRKRFAPTLAPDVLRRSIQFGRLVAAAIFAWSRSDGGHEGYMFNYPADYVPPIGAGLWEPTPPAYLGPLQPHWGQNRPFVLASGATCAPPSPPAYSTDPASPMFQEAREVVETVKNLTPDQREIALYWADDPSLTATPPGHWMVIATQVLRTEHASLALAAETYARLGMALSDAFVACWNAKFTYNRIRPISYIRQVIDPTWNRPAPTDPVITPPFPEYTSGHATSSGATARVLTAIFGENYAFEDRSQQRLGFAPRSFASFDAAAEEAAMSRLYGGIHFRSANENGLAQGRCIGDQVMKLEMSPPVTRP